MGETHVKMVRTGETQRQCPNCGYYKVVTVNRRAFELKEVSYDGWRFWKDTATKMEVRDSGDGEHCEECGWDSFEMDIDAEEEDVGDEPGSDDEHVTLCYDRMDGETYMELCVTAYADTIEEAEQKASVEIAQCRDKIE